MSQFLGPIHYRMFEKVNQLDNRTQNLLKATDPSLLAEVDGSCGVIAQGKLDEMIDLGNIHGWLSAQVEIAECRYAHAVHALLQAGKTVEELETIEREYARAHAPGKVEGMQQQFHSLDGFYLDGMPCDKGMAVTATEDSIQFVVGEGAHAPYWNLGTPVSVYETLRTSAMQETAEGLGAQITRVAPFTYQLESK